MSVKGGGGGGDGGCCWVRCEGCCVVDCWVGYWCQSLEGILVIHDLGGGKHGLGDLVC